MPKLVGKLKGRVDRLFRTVTSEVPPLFVPSSHLFSTSLRYPGHQLVFRTPVLVTSVCPLASCLTLHFGSNLKLKWKVLSANCHSTPGYKHVMRRLDIITMDKVWVTLRVWNSHHLSTRLPQGRAEERHVL